VDKRAIDGVEFCRTCLAMTACGNTQHWCHKACPVVHSLRQRVAPSVRHQLAAPPCMSIFVFAFRIDDRLLGLRKCTCLLLRSR
jgi:hypothetical protein